MEAKTPALLVVLVETERLRWFVASIPPDGPPVPLLRSEEDDLATYRGLDLDEQVAFLRHRFCGVLQRGCDRLWAREKKPKQFVILFDGPLAEATGKLTSRIAEHFAEWMLNPPVAVFINGCGLRSPGSPPLDRLAGEIAPALEEVVHTSLDGLLAAREDSRPWEVVAKKV